MWNSIPGVPYGKTDKNSILFLKSSSRSRLASFQILLAKEKAIQGNCWLSWLKKVGWILMWVLKMEVKR